MDPAGPFFDDAKNNETRGLYRDSAQFVTALHTNMGVYGTRMMLGHSDFYANPDLKQQPGCGKIDNSCSHRRACELYYASCFPEFQFIGVDCETRSPLDSSIFGFFNDGIPGCYQFNTTDCFGFAEKW